MGFSASKQQQQGFTLVEVIIATMVITVMAYTIGRVFLSNSRQSVANRQRTFAMQKALQMMEELRGVAAAGGSMGTLDSYSDGASYSSLLTTQLPPYGDPGDVLSGNGSEIYKRQITVQRVPTSDSIRRVWVRVYRASDGRELADIGAVLGTIKTDFVPTQTYDLYVIMLDDFGWYGGQPSIVTTAIQDLETRNPGLNFRIHWITRRAYGRDPYYSPYRNIANLADTIQTPEVYVDAFQSTHCTADLASPCPAVAPPINTVHMILDGVVTPPLAQWSPLNYSIADRANHAVRAVDEALLYAQTTTYAVANGQPVPEISMRMLLDQMTANPNQFLNAMILENGGFPLVALRNYSDAAKDFTVDQPTTTWYRVVTHPEQLSYIGGQDVYLRVYAYNALVSNMTDPFNDTAQISTMTVYLPNVPYNAPSIDASMLQITSGTPAVPITYSWVDQPSGYYVPGPGPGGVGTLITLYSTPIRMKQATDGSGLNSSQLLYGMEYIPCETGGGAQFDPTNFTGSDSRALYKNNPKNTAVWRIKLSGTALTAGTTIWVETRMGSDLTTGTMANKPYDLSRTYVYYGLNPPASEQYQFVGDPRHMPYVDLKNQGNYNWYFNTTVASMHTNFNWLSVGFSNWTAGGWQNESGERFDYDYPRYCQLWRHALMGAQTIYGPNSGNFTKFPDLGGDMIDTNQVGYPFLETLWDNAAVSNSVMDVSEGVGKLSDTTGTNQIVGEKVVALSKSGTPIWAALPWLGELFPDTAVTGSSNLWMNLTPGNLPSLPLGGGLKFYRADYSTLSSAAGPYNGFFDSWTVSSFANGRGLPTLLNGTDPNNPGNFSRFLGGSMDVATVNALGQTLVAAFNTILYPTLTAYAPLTPAETSASYAPAPGYSGETTNTYLREAYYDDTTAGPPWEGTGLIEFVKGATGAIMAFGGIATGASFSSTSSSLTQQQRYSMTIQGMLRGLFRGGSSNTAMPILQVPQVALTAPLTSDSFPLGTPSVVVQWTTSNVRWDGNPYTELPGGYSIGSPYCNLKYSPDNGHTWLWFDGTSAQAGVGDPTRAITSPATWDISSLPQGTYLLCVEAYRSNSPLHYASHQRQVYIGN